MGLAIEVVPYYLEGRIQYGLWIALLPGPWPTKIESLVPVKAWMIHFSALTNCFILDISFFKGNPNSSPLSFIIKGGGQIEPTSPEESKHSRDRARHSFHQGCIENSWLLLLNGLEIWFKTLIEKIGLFLDKPLSLQWGFSLDNLEYCTSSCCNLVMSLILVAVP